MKYLKFILIVWFLFTFNLRAETIIAETCSQADVETAIAASSDGDTISIPAGECEWSATTTLSGDKKLTLHGAGKTLTIITKNPEGLLLDLSTSGSRVSAIGFINGTIRSDGYGFRVDHCSMDLATWGSGIIGQSRNVRSPNTPTSYGLIDNCVFNNVRILATGTNYLLSEDGSQNDLWADALELGTNQAVYVEDNSFTTGTNIIDSNYGGKYVFRFNTVTDGNIEAHSVQGANRAARKWEIYNNAIDITEGYAQVFLRGGTGVIFNNITTDDVRFRIDNVRSYTDPGDGVGLCDGDALWDGNDDATGWPCRDQIGMGIDTSLWTDENPYPAQTKVPAYFWSNYLNENPLLASVVNDSSDHIKADRDYYDFDTSFDGTSGVGTGVLASIPATCTAGVGYWATDQGDWNASGDDGVLYKCTSTDTWEVYYEPYDYPHPLRCYGRRGDANLSETITIADVVAVLKHIAGTATLEGVALTAADADEDSDVDGDDVTRILQHITGASPLEY